MTNGEVIKNDSVNVSLLILMFFFLIVDKLTWRSRHYEMQYKTM